MNKKGFSPIEILVTIIVIGAVFFISIPIISSIEEKAKEKTFKSAASSVSLWVDKQYQSYKMNLDNSIDLPIDIVFSSLCVKKNNNIGCDEEVHLITYNLIIAAGIRMSTIITKYQTTKDTIDDMIITKEDYANYKNYKISRIYINPDTSRSCVTLISEETGEYPKNEVACGGVCQSSNINAKDYCKEGLIE